MKVKKAANLENLTNYKNQEEEEEVSRRKNLIPRHGTEQRQRQFDFSSSAAAAANGERGQFANGAGGGDDVRQPGDADPFEH